MTQLSAPIRETALQANLREILRRKTRVRELERQISSELAHIERELEESRRFVLTGQSTGNRYSDFVIGAFRDVNQGLEGIYVALEILLVNIPGQLIAIQRVADEPGSTTVEGYIALGVGARIAFDVHAKTCSLQVPLVVKICDVDDDTSGHETLSGPLTLPSPRLIYEALTHHQICLPLNPDFSHIEPHYILDGMQIGTESVRRWAKDKPGHWKRIIREFHISE